MFKNSHLKYSAERTQVIPRDIYFLHFTLIFLKFVNVDLDGPL